MQSQATIPALIESRGNTWAQNILLVAGGVAGISLLAQVALPLPFTPVPLTGQTFGVALVSLLFGRKRAFATLLSYLGLGALGLPVFSLGSSGFAWGPTLGYLLGMLFASLVVGTLADLGLTRTFLRSYLAATAGSLITFICGLTVLSFFLPLPQLITAGLLPFLPGDILKNLAAAFLATRANKFLSRE